MAANRSNLHVAASAAGISVLMLGAAYAAVPLYKLFCQVTGFGGTTQRAAHAPDQPASQTIMVRFDANTSTKLKWSFHAVTEPLKVRIGEQNMATYRARNMADVPLTGMAVFNVTPPQAGAYFNKIECFCFTEQSLAPGESVDMPVAFFVDPDLLDDPDAASIREITLSYTFYPVDKPQALSQAPVAPATAGN